MKEMLLLTCLILKPLAHGTDDKITFQYNFRKNEVIHSHMVINSQVQSNQVVMTMDSSMHVDDVKDDGSAVLSTQIDHGEMKMGSMKMNLPLGGKRTIMTVSKYGKRLEMKDKKVSVSLQEFPDHAIGVGESWDGAIVMQGQRDAMEINAHFTLDSLKTVDGHQVAHVLVVEDGDASKDMHVHATGWMDWDTSLGIATIAHVEGTETMGKMQNTFTTDQASTIDG